MQAFSHDMGMPARYGARPPVPLELLMPRLQLPPAWRPALMTALRLAMGTCVGAVLGVAAGHGDFWALTGTGLGAALEAIARRS